MRLVCDTEERWPPFPLKSNEGGLEPFVKEVEYYHKLGNVFLFTYFGESGFLVVYETECKLWIILIMSRLNVIISLT